MAIRRWRDLGTEEVGNAQQKCAQQCPATTADLMQDRQQLLASTYLLVYLEEAHIEFRLVDLATLVHVSCVESLQARKE